MRVLTVVVLMCAAAMQSVRAQDWDPHPRRSRRDGAQVRIGKDYYLPANQVVSWPVVVIGGAATLDGRVDDDVVVIGGPVRIGPAAEIRANIVAIGGEVEAADTARISGEIHDISVLWPEIRFAVRDWLFGIDRGWWAAFSLAGTIFRFTLTLLTTCVLSLIAPRWIRRIQGRVADAPLASGFVGLAAEMLALPVGLVVVAGLVLTVIGIPLLVFVPFVALAFAATWAAGFTAVAARIGGLVRDRAGLATPDSTAIDAAWGVLLLFGVTFVGNVLAFLPVWPITTFNIAGFVIEYLAWTVGLGAALLAPLQRRWGVSPPPIPSTASA